MLRRGGFEILRRRWVEIWRGWEGQGLRRGGLGRERIEGGRGRIENGGRGEIGGGG